MTKNTITTDQLVFFLRELAAEIRRAPERPGRLAYARDAEEIARDLESGACTITNTVPVPIAGGPDA